MTPAAGILHAIFPMIFILVAAPFAAFIPLAEVLAVVAWKVIEMPAILVLLRSGWGEPAVLGTTFFLTIFRDLTEAIIAGFALGSVLFIHRMSLATAVQIDTRFVGEDLADDVAPRGTYDEARFANPEVAIYRMSGALFFGAAASIGAVLERISDTHRSLIIDLSAVPFLDSSRANPLEGLLRKTQRKRIRL